MKQMRYIALALSMAVLLMTLTACGGGGEETPTTTVNADGTLSGEATDTLNVYMCAEYLNEDAANELIDQLTSSLDMFSDGGVTVNLTCVATGSGEDPTMQMAGMMKLTAAIAAQEVDVVIADEANAARNARSDTFYALSDLLTEDEISALGTNALSYSLLDDQGEPTGESTPACGVDLSSDTRFDAVFGDVPVGVFVAANSPNLENSKALLRGLIGGLDSSANASVQDSGDDAAQDALDAASGEDSADAAGTADTVATDDASAGTEPAGEASTGSASTDAEPTEAPTDDAAA